MALSFYNAGVLDWRASTSGLLQTPPDPKRRTPPFQLKSKSFEKFFLKMLFVCVTI